MQFHLANTLLLWRYSCKAIQVPKNKEKQKKGRKLIIIGGWDDWQYMYAPLVNAGYFL